jgi:hypothetical protein
MTTRDRIALKGYFADGQRPTGTQFADLIDSCVNAASDGLTLPMNGEPLGITAQKDTKKLLNFYEGSVLQWGLSLTNSAFNLTDHSGNPVVTVTSTPSSASNIPTVSVAGDQQALRSWSGGAADGAGTAIDAQTAIGLLGKLKIVNVALGNEFDGRPTVVASSIPRELQAGVKLGDIPYIDYNALVAVLVAAAAGQAAQPANIANLAATQTEHKTTLQEHATQLEEHGKKLGLVTGALKDLAEKGPGLGEILKTVVGLL